MTARRWDLAVKTRFFRHLLGGNDPDAERVYRWHIEARKAANASIGLGMDGKVDTDRYVLDAALLISSMTARGFDSSYPVPVDPNGELLDGSHRVACALALRIAENPVRNEAQYVWAPPWGEQWFIDRGMGQEDLERLRQDWEAMRS